MTSRVLPLPSILNEESFCRFPTRDEFVLAMRCLVEVVKKMQLYGFASQIGCSSALWDRVCYGEVTFREWLRQPGGLDVVENNVRRYLRQALSKVPRLEEGYAVFNEAPDFDLLWNGRMIYVNPERTIPAFVVAICFELPTMALPVEDFVQSTIQSPIVRELVGEEIRERTKTVHSLADLSQVELEDGYLQNLIQRAVVDEDGFKRVKGGMFPDLVFSHEVEDALKQHQICFRSIPVLAALIRLQKAFVKMCSENIGFEEAYGRIKSLAMNESATVRQRYPDTRRFTWDDGCRYCYPHVKIGNSFRIHFTPEKDTGKLYVGYMGYHLPL